MPHQPPHPSTVFPSHARSLRVLVTLLAEMTQGLEKAIRFTEADSQRMVPITKNGAELLSQLMGKLDEYPRYQGPDWYEELLRQATESRALFGQATQQIQFYDILRQQLTHLRQTHQALAAEIDRLVPGNGNQSAVRYLPALSEIVQLHTVQLTRIREQYEAEIEEWQTQLQRTVEKLTRLGKKLTTHEKDWLPKNAAGADLSGPLQGLIAGVVNGWQRFRQQEPAPVQFRAVVAAAQAGLIEIAREARHLNPVADPAARASALMHLRAGYTMQSERTLHDQVLDGLPTGETASARPPQDHINQEIELF
ncbi:MAG: hypothetical protein H7Z75_22390 [Ferruginibacter sp.]|nr:hypothetical protein [Cytophagales bacterium]